jgi:hypothetical protein
MIASCWQSAASGLAPSAAVLCSPKQCRLLQRQHTVVSHRRFQGYDRRVQAHATEYGISTGGLSHSGRELRSCVATRAVESETEVLDAEAHAPTGRAPRGGSVAYSKRPSPASLVAGWALCCLTNQVVIRSRGCHVATSPQFSQVWSGSSMLQPLPVQGVPEREIATLQHRTGHLARKYAPPLQSLL